MTSSFKAAIFDFDYTLADSSEGVVECVNYALRGVGLPEANADEIRSTIGLPLPEILVRLAGRENSHMCDEYVALFVEKADKRELLADILKSEETGRTLVFTRTKHAANRVVRMLEKRGIRADSIHSNKSQSQRQRALAAFVKGKVPVLVATDIVSRGLDVDGITHVINYELPEDAENYLHRIGRTARAGRAGIALTLCDLEEVSLLRGVERFTRVAMKVWEDHRWHAASIAACLAAANRAARVRAGRSRTRFGR